MNIDFITTIKLRTIFMHVKFYAYQYVQIRLHSQEHKKSNHTKVTRKEVRDTVFHKVLSFDNCASKVSCFELPGTVKRISM